MSNGETHTPENMTKKGMPSASLSARDEARINGLEVTTNKLSRDVGVLQEKMTHLATHKDIAEVKSEIADVKVEVAQVRAEVSELRAENRENISQLESRMWRAIGIQTGIILTPILIALANKLI